MGDRRISLDKSLLRLLAVKKFYFPLSQLPWAPPSLICVLYPVYAKRRKVALSGNKSVFEINETDELTFIAKHKNMKTNNISQIF